MLIIFSSAEDLDIVDVKIPVLVIIVLGGDGTRGRFRLLLLQWRVLGSVIVLDLDYKNIYHQHHHKPTANVKVFLLSLHNIFRGSMGF